jgi:hypothetical protein
MDRENHKPLPMRALRAAAPCRLAARQPAPAVGIGSPAIEVMTDLRQAMPATIGRGACLHDADQMMRVRGVRLLFVVASDGSVEGLITARDTVGEKPVSLLHHSGGKYSDLTVDDLMVPREAIEVLDLDAVRHAEVGHIVATLREVGRQHATVVDRDAASGAEMICGVFSVTQIARQLGVPIQIFDVARSFAQIAAHLAAQ